MAQIVDVPGYGEVEFPDSMSKSDIEEVINKNTKKFASDVKDKIPRELYEDQSFIHKIANNSITSGILGAGDASQNFLANLVNFIPGINAPRLKTGEGAAYNVGNILGNLGTFAAGGSALGSARLGAEAIPYLGRIAQTLGGEGLRGVARRGVGSAAFGAIENPQERGQAALEGVALSSLADLLPGAIGKISGGFRPGKYSEELLHQTFPKQLSESKKIAHDLYSSVMDPFGSQPIVINKLNKDAFFHTKGLEDLYDEFEKNPTIHNAHRLQSQLGSEASEIKGTDVSSKDRINLYKKEREKIKNSLYKTLGSKYPEAAEKYKEATKYYEENVIPYRMLHYGIEKKVGVTPESLLKHLERVQKHPSFPSERINEVRIPKTPVNITNQEKKLEKLVGNRNLVERLSGIGTGLTAGHLLGLPHALEVGGIVGALAAPAIGDIFKKRIPAFTKERAPYFHEKLSKLIEPTIKFTKSSAPDVLKQSLLANLLAGTE